MACLSESLALHNTTSVTHPRFGTMHKRPAADYTRGLTHQPFIPLCAYWTQYKNGIAPRGKAPRRDPYRQDSESEDEGDMPITHEDILLMQDSAAGFLTGLDLPYVACLPVQGQDCPCCHLSPASATALPLLAHLPPPVHMEGRTPCQLSASRITQ